MLLWAFTHWAAIWLLCPETYLPVLLRNKATKKRKETGDNRWYALIEKMDRSVAQVSSSTRAFTSRKLTLYRP